MRCVGGGVARSVGRSGGFALGLVGARVAAVEYTVVGVATVASTAITVASAGPIGATMLVSRLAIPGAPQVVSEPHRRGSLQDASVHAGAAAHRVSSRGRRCTRSHCNRRTRGRLVATSRMRLFHPRKPLERATGGGSRAAAGDAVAIVCRRCPPQGCDSRWAATLSGRRTGRID